MNDYFTTSNVSLIGTSASSASAFRRGGVRSILFSNSDLIKSRFSYAYFAKIALLILTAFSVLLLVSGSAMAATEIHSVNDLKKIGTGASGSGWTMDDDYILMQNITITDAQWRPIGSNIDLPGDFPVHADEKLRRDLALSLYGAQPDPFTGTFDGQEYSITFQNNAGLTTFMTDGLFDAAGLFGLVEDVTLTNLTIVVKNDMVINNNYYENNFNAEDFTNNRSSRDLGILSGIVTSTFGSTGSTIENCHVIIDSNVVVDGGFSFFTGGLVSRALGPLNVENCHILNKGVFISDGPFGGFVGVSLLESTSISNSSFVGNISGTTVGGMVGLVANNIDRDGFSNSINNYSGLINLQNCTYMGNINGQNQVGGLVGRIGANSVAGHLNTIENCTSIGNINGQNQVGGAIGSIEGVNSTIINVHYNGNITTTGNFAGGLVGLSTRTSSSSTTDANIDIFVLIENSTATGSVLSTGSNISGLLGHTITNATIKNSAASMEKIEGVNYIGGLVGQQGIANATVLDSSDNPIYIELNIENCTVASSIVGASTIGGFVGAMANGLITNSSSEGSVVGTTTAAGFIGNILVGATHPLNVVTIEDCLSYSSVEATGVTSGTLSAGSNLGGFIGRVQGATIISRCAAYGDVTLLPHSTDSTLIGTSAGGFAGNLTNASVEIYESFATGNVYADNRAGGFVGYINQKAIIEDCYATGTVTNRANDANTYYKGGFVGFITAGSAVANSEITNCYTSSDSFIGLMSGSTKVTFTDCFDQSTGAAVAGVKSITDAQMKDIDTFDGTTAGMVVTAWDIEEYGTATTEIWTIVDDLLYPRLTWQKIYDDYVIYVNDASHLGLIGATPFTEQADANGDLKIWLPNAKYVQIGDVTFSGQKDAAIVTAPFKGIYDGTTFAIRNLNISNVTTDNIGLFSVIDGAKISNVTLANAIVTGKDNVGALAGSAANSKITQCYVDSDGEVYGANQVGGLVGSGIGLIVIDSSSDAFVSSGGNDAGGLVGSLEGSISKSSSNGSITSLGNNAGGLVGTLLGSVSESFFNGTVNSASDSGGLVGVLTDGSISQSYAKGKVDSAGNVGGLIGTVTKGTVSESYSENEVTSTGSNAGGLVGVLKEGTISDAYAVGNVAADKNAGGLVGLVDHASAEIKKSFSAALSVSSVTDTAGGLIGKLDSNVALYHCFALEKSVSAPVNANRIIGDSNSKTVSETGVFAFSDIEGTFDTTSPDYGTSVTLDRIWDVFPLGAWGSIVSSFWTDSSDANYRIPILRWQTTSPNVDISHLKYVASSSDNGGRGTGGPAIISNNTTTSQPPVTNYTPPSTGTNDSSQSGDDNGSGTSSNANDSGKSGFFESIKNWFGNHKILGYGGLFLLIIIILVGVVYYFRYYRED